MDTFVAFLKGVNIGGIRTVDSYENENENSGKSKNLQDES